MFTTDLSLMGEKEGINTMKNVQIHEKNRRSRFNLRAIHGFFFTVSWKTLEASEGHYTQGIFLPTNYGSERGLDPRCNIQHCHRPEKKEHSVLSIKVVVDASSRQVVELDQNREDYSFRITFFSQDKNHNFLHMAQKYLPFPFYY